LFDGVPNAENGVGKPNTGDREEVFAVFGAYGGPEADDDDPGVEI